MGTLQGQRKTVAGVAFFPDGERLASVAMENRVILWDLRTRAQCATLWGGPDEAFASVAAFGDGRGIACGLTDARVRLWMAD